MAGPNKSRRVLQEQRRHEIVRLFVRGASQMAISDALGVSQSTVSRDLRTIMERWQRDATSEINRLKARELGALNQVESEAWGGYDRSCQAAPVVEGEKPKRPPAGDSRWLAIIQGCIDRRMRLLGLAVPEKLVMQGVNPNDLPWLEPEPAEPAAENNAQSNGTKRI